MTYTNHVGQRSGRNPVTHLASGISAISSNDAYVAQGLRRPLDRRTTRSKRREPSCSAIRDAERFFRSGREFRAQHSGRNHTGKLCVRSDGVSNDQLRFRSQQSWVAHSGTCLAVSHARSTAEPHTGVCHRGSRPHSKTSDSSLPCSSFLLVPGLAPAALGQDAASTPTVDPNAPVKAFEFYPSKTGLGSFFEATIKPANIRQDGRHNRQHRGSRSGNPHVCHECLYERWGRIRHGPLRRRRRTR